MCCLSLLWPTASPRDCCNKYLTVHCVLLAQHHGKEVIANILGWPADHPDLDTVYLRIYRQDSPPFPWMPSAAALVNGTCMQSSVLQEDLQNSVADVPKP